MSITRQQIQAFAAHLRQAERSPGTIENYLRHVRAFAAWLAGRPVTKEAAADWKEYLLDKGYCPTTINAMLGGLNRFLAFVGWQECQVKALRLQRQLFRDDSKELTRAEYDRLITTAHTLGRERLALLMETIFPIFKQGLKPNAPDPGKTGTRGGIVLRFGRRGLTAPPAH